MFPKRVFSDWFYALRYFPKRGLVVPEPALDAEIVRVAADALTCACVRDNVLAVAGLRHDIMER